MTYSIFTVLPAFVILFWLVLFSIDAKKNIAKRFLIFFLLIALVNYLIHWLYFNNNYQAYCILDSIWIFTSLCIFPLYYYYIRLLAIDPKIDYKWRWILIPAVALSLFSVATYLMMSPQEIEIFTNEILYPNRPPSGDYSTLIKMQVLKMNLFKVILTVEVIATVVYGFRLIKWFNLRVMAYYSDVEHRELYNIQMTLIFLLATAIISIISTLVGKGFFIDKPHLLSIPSIAHSFVLFGICFAGYRQSFSIRELTVDQFQYVDEEPLEEENEEEFVDEDERIVLGSKYEELYVRMEYLLNNEQIFKNSDLRLDDLASKMGSNRTYVSRLINNKTDYNFCEYINSHRIAHAKKLLSSEDVKQLSLEEIAMESGFSSLSSFYRIFVKMEEITPAKYRKRVKNLREKN